MTNKKLGLHDFLLKQVCFEWENATAVAEVEGWDHENKSKLRGKLIFKGAHSVVIPQQSPWGRSEFIMSVEVFTLDTDESETIIEMQSGDTIKIRSKEVPRFSVSLCTVL